MKPIQAGTAIPANILINPTTNRISVIVYPVVYLTFELEAREVKGLREIWRSHFNRVFGFIELQP
jgi:hypothetical protein